MLNKHAHAGCTGFKSMLPADKICTQGAGCTLNLRANSALYWGTEVVESEEVWIIYIYTYIYTKLLN